MPNFISNSNFAASLLKFFKNRDNLIRIKHESFNIQMKITQKTFENYAFDATGRGE